MTGATTVTDSVPAASTLRRIGATDVRVTALALGGGPLGGLFTPVPHEQAVATVRAAREHGIGYVDTAPHYGSGRSELAIAEAVGQSPCTLSTKVGRWLRPVEPGTVDGPPIFADPLPNEQVWDWSADGIRRTLEDSLGRLGRDHADIVYLHDPDDHEDEVYATAYPALARLRDEGIVGAIGAGMNQTEMLTRFVQRLDIDVVLCAGRYTVLDRSAERDLLPACLTGGTSFIAAGVFNSGLLADPHHQATFDYKPAPPELIRQAHQFHEVCSAHNIPLKAAAIQFPHRHPAVTATLVGCRSPEEVTEDITLFHQPIPPALWDDLDTLHQQHDPS